jgi:hypothetical protein
MIATSEDLNSQQIQNDVAKEMKYLIKKRNGVFESDRAMYSLCSYLSKAFESQNLNHYAGIFSYYAKTKFNENISFYSPFDYYDNKTDIRSVEKLVHIFQKVLTRLYIIQKYGLDLHYCICMISKICAHLRGTAYKT